ncbi:hypothetical protein [Streptomyces ficellus]|uniref:Uncharacterized protein n=1 Tax=Streptomyces ficellus TaxID=1977088 RepID=A0A6I6FWI2_9ACTN|nr:hypothetical protein [Streptomyces ficellus]QGV82256.1 hypothetical protein EIZ62_31375 [Streptomyces ficellus]
MALGPRFHVDQDGHSVTVQFLGASGGFEVLVDGKAVAYGPDRSGAGTVTAEFPGDPPRPLRVIVSRPREMGGEPFCVLETGRMRYLLPRVPLGGAGKRALPAGRPVRRGVRRSLRRFARGFLTRRAGRR